MFFKSELRQQHTAKTVLKDLEKYESNKDFIEFGIAQLKDLAEQINNTDRK